MISPEKQPSDALKALLDTPFTFDPMRDPTWRPTRDHYADAVRILRDTRAERDALKEALRPFRIIVGAFLDERERSAEVERLHRVTEGEQT